MACRARNQKKKKTVRHEAGGTKPRSRAVAQATPSWRQAAFVLLLRVAARRCTAGQHAGVVTLERRQGVGEGRRGGLGGVSCARPSMRQGRGGKVAGCAGTCGRAGAPRAARAVCFRIWHRICHGHERAPTLAPKDSWSPSTSAFFWAADSSFASDSASGWPSTIVRRKEKKTLLPVAAGAGARQQKTRRLDAGAERPRLHTEAGARGKPTLGPCTSAAAAAAAAARPSPDRLPSRNEEGRTARAGLLTRHLVRVFLQVVDQQARWKDEDHVGRHVRQQVGQPEVAAAAQLREHAHDEWNLGGLHRVWFQEA